MCKFSVDNPNNGKIVQLIKQYTYHHNVSHKQSLLIISEQIHELVPRVQYITDSKERRCEQLALMAGPTPGKCALDNVNSNFMLQQYQLSVHSDGEIAPTDVYLGAIKIVNCRFYHYKCYEE